MKMGRLAVTGVAVVALAGLSACTGDNKEPASTGASAPAAAESAATGSKAAAQELAAAATKLTSSSGKMHLTMAGGVTGDGAFDTPNQAVTMTMNMSGLGAVDVRQVGTDLYMKFGGEAAKTFGTKWMHVDASKMPSDSMLSLERNDPRNTAKMLATTTEVTKTGSGDYSGLMDYSKAPGMTAEMLKGLNGKNTQVPFTAKVNSDGYLSAMSMSLDTVAAGAGKIEAEYSDFGAKADIARPAKSQTVEMPASMLKTFGG